MFEQLRVPIERRSRSPQSLRSGALDQSARENTRPKSALSTHAGKKVGRQTKQRRRQDDFGSDYRGSEPEELLQVIVRLKESMLEAERERQALRVELARSQKECQKQHSQLTKLLSSQGYMHGPTVAEIRQDVEKSTLVRQLKAQIYQLRSEFVAKQSELDTLRKSQRACNLVELVAENEEYLIEVQRLQDVTTRLEAELQNERYERKCEQEAAASSDTRLRNEISRLATELNALIVINNTQEKQEQIPTMNTASNRQFTSGSASPTKKRERPKSATVRSNSLTDEARDRAGSNSNTAAPGSVATTKPVQRPKSALSRIAKAVESAKQADVNRQDAGHKTKQQSKATTVRLNGHINTTKEDMHTQQPSQRHDPPRQTPSEKPVEKSSPSQQRTPQPAVPVVTAGEVDRGSEQKAQHTRTAEPRNKTGIAQAIARRQQPQQKPPEKPTAATKKPQAQSVRPQPSPSPSPSPTPPPSLSSEIKKGESLANPTASAHTDRQVEQSAEATTPTTALSASDTNRGVGKAAAASQPGIAQARQSESATAEINDTASDNGDNQSTAPEHAIIPDGADEQRNAPQQAKVPQAHSLDTNGPIVPLSLTEEAPTAEKQPSPVQETFALLATIDNDADWTEFLDGLSDDEDAAHGNTHADEAKHIDALVDAAITPAPPIEQQQRTVIATNATTAQPEPITATVGAEKEEEDDEDDYDADFDESTDAAGTA